VPSAAPSDQALYDQLALYSLELRDPSFLHQNIVDAYTAQHAGATTKPIAIVFALIGLYLHVEKNFTGRQVQLAHMRMARRRRHWTAPPLTTETAAIGVADVVATPPGPARDAMIRRWCESVWQSWHSGRPFIAAIARAELGVAD
jgi:hypothetical protein